MRYERQKNLVNQEKLRSSTVLIAGIGGLGSLSSIYLTLAGVGKIIVVDGDRVEESNLNRQVLYNERDIGHFKAEIAAHKLKEINSDVEIIGIRENIEENFDIPYKIDIIVDGLDNIKARYIIEDYALSINVPYVFGAVEGYMGMVTFIDRSTKRLKDFIHKLPTKTPQVLGATASFTASLQVLETIKYLVGRGELLKNRLLIYDALSTNFLEVRL